MKAAPALLDIAAVWQARLRPVERRALSGALLCLAVVASLVARWGTAPTRVLAASLLGGYAVGVVARWSWQRRQVKRSTDRVAAIVDKLDPALAARLGRAVALVQSPAGHVSAELAELHLQRIVAQVPLRAVEELADGRARRLNLLANVVILLSLGFVMFAPLRVFEGMNVLLARHDVAPLPMHLVELGSVTVQPPAYLRGSPDTIDFDASSSQPRGSKVIVRGIPARDGLRLVVTDGVRDVPFVSDGQGGITARYQLESTVRLRVAARFGRVLVIQRSELLLDAIPDQAPVVELDGAPRRVSIGDVSEVDLRYSATDDHGIRQIELVLRAGAREERRPLVRLDGATHQYAGAYVLEADDAFLTSSYGPVEVLVAARDDNNADGASCGQSEAITIVKPSLGQAQVRRRDAYLELRDGLVDWLASVQGKSSTTAELDLHRANTLAKLTELESGALNEISIRKLIRAFLRAQHDKLLRAPTDPRRFVPLLEEVTLSVESAFEAIAHRDAEQVSRLLADVSNEIEAAAKSTLLGEQKEPGMARIRAAEATLGTGAVELKRLGLLGADLGEIARAGWLRIGHALDAGDLANVERAASFLTERLRRPTPSFVGGGLPGVESGRRGNGRSTGQKASETDAHLERVATELQQLAREHASGIEAVERLVEDSERGLGTGDMRAVAKQHADDIRHAIEVLPPLGAEPGSVRAALGLGKELARGAAQSLEQLQLMGAYEGLRKTDAAIAEAMALRSALGAADSELEPRAIDDIRKRLAEHRDWLKSKLDELRESGLTKVRDLLRQASAREREMAERAVRLAHREAQHDAVLPEDVRNDLEQSSRLMRRAADSLDSGTGRAALERQREAQNLLERNVLGSDQEPADTADKVAKRESDASRRTSSGDTRIVSTGDTESREAFRRRVQQGLSRDVTPELSPAVRRYAEGLLK